MSSVPLKKILYAEDEDDIREIAVLAIETLGGFTCATCNSGVDVIALAHSFAPQLILLDVMMPIMDGPSTLLALKKEPNLKHIPIVFLTAKIMTEEINDLRTMGAINVIGKPFDPMTLADQIQTIWNHHYD
jgi:CheY-like chemotaxis protein